MQNLALIDYTNHRGRRARRRVQPISIRFGHTDWHPEDQWLLLAFDSNHKAEREFAMRDIHSWEPANAQI